VIGLVAPHAGYVYSGAVAGHAFKTVQGRTFDCVCVLSPMHQYYPQPLLTSAHKAYRTPLGEIPLADGKIDLIHNRLVEKIGIGLTPIAKDQEHSLEIELPFLQVALAGDFTLIPIMLRDQSRSVTKALGEVLADVLDPVTSLLVASSDSRISSPNRRPTGWITRY
jgi:MEMO1 family protein